MITMTAHEIEIKNCNVIVTDNSSSYDTFSSIPKDKDISYDYFFQEFLSKNLPCVIANASDGWECASDWVLDNGINYTYLLNKYGELDAPVADCAEFKYDSQCKSDMKVQEYVQYLMSSGESEQKLYLKDWHLRRARPADHFYTVPPLFASDWLNEYATDRHEDDFMFVYIGPAGTWTPLHADVYCSYSWSVNVVGCKRWLLFPPGEENKLRDPLGNLPLHFDSKLYQNVKCFEVIQERGDGIFVPSGWYHQVSNVVETISVNHNWINACNVRVLWNALAHNLRLVHKEIQEFQGSEGFSQHCQLMLKSLFGMDYKSFVEFVMHIGKKRLAQQDGEKFLSFGEYSLGPNHLRLDLCALDDLLQDIVAHSALKEILEPDNYNKVTDLAKQIKDKL